MMITGAMKSELQGNARIWTLTVPAEPRPGQLIAWSEPAVGSIPARSGVRGWVSSEPSTRPGTVLVTVATEGSRWVIINVQPAGDTEPAASRSGLVRDAVIQGLTIEGMPYSRIENLINKAMRYGTWDSEIFGIRLTVTNSGMPAEFRIERI